MKRFLSALATLVVVFTAVVAISSPASASFSSCPASTFCVWIDSNGGGSMYFWDTGHLNGCTNIGNPFNDQVSSIRNRYASPWKVSTYRDAGCTGVITSRFGSTQNYVGPNQQMNMFGSDNDSSSSFRVWL